MKIVLAPDSYKGSLSAVQVSAAMEKAIRRLDKNIDIVLKPMADGGEGTLDCLLYATKSEKVSLFATGPRGKQQETYYGLTSDKVALIEVANIAGLQQLPEGGRHPENTTSYGLGEVILQAYDRGCRSFIIGLGGSATNDGGLGMLQALGLQAYDEQGNLLQGFGRDLLKIHTLDTSKLKKIISEIKIQVASDVDNPLCGSRGATAVYGPQKGIKENEIVLYDQALNKFSSLIEDQLGVSCRHISGAGAAGGLGFALLSIGAELVSGAKLVAETIQLDEAISSANLVITGEGQSDEQTLYGKAPSFVAKTASKYKLPTVLISGAVVGNRDKLLDTFSACFSIANQPLTLKECLENAEELVFEQTKQIVSLWKELKNKE